MILLFEQRLPFADCKQNAMQGNTLKCTMHTSYQLVFTHTNAFNTLAKRFWWVFVLDP